MTSQDPIALVRHLMALEPPLLEILEMLELAAVADGLKPVAAITLTSHGAPPQSQLFGILAAARLTTIVGHMWSGNDEFAGCSDWYANAAKAHRSDEPILFVSQPCHADLVTGATRLDSGLSVSEEAALLGYPACCVATQRDRSRLFHRLNAVMIERAVGGDLARCQRFVRSGVALTPQDKEERRRLNEALCQMPAPYTSINMCDACAAEPDSPAHHLSQSYKKLAQQVGLGN